MALARICYNLAQCFRHLQLFQKAFEYLNEYYTINVQAGNIFGKFKALYEIADLYLASKDLNKSAEMLENLSKSLKPVLLKY